AELGDIHYGRKRIQPSSRELRRFYATARDVLRHEPLPLTDDDILLVGRTLGDVVRRRGYTCYACAVMPEHAHLLIRRHRDKSEEMLAHFQRATREAVFAAGRRPVTHPVWGGPGWKVYLSTREDLTRIEKYVRENPLKSGRPIQQWDFVKAYDGWVPAYQGRAGANRQAGVPK